MSDLQTICDEYTAKHGHAPNATQLSLVAGIKYRAASSFLRERKGGRTSKPRSQTLINTKPINLFRSTPTKPRTSSFSDEVLYADQDRQKSSSPHVDYSGSTTGANNPWKRFQKKPKSAYSTFSPSFMSTKPISLPKATQKQATTSTNKDVKSPKAPKQPITTTQSVSAVIPSTSSNTKRRGNASMSKSLPSLNISDLQSDLVSLNARYERVCQDIRQQFEDIRNELTKKENMIIANLTKYTNECKAMMEGNISKMEKEFKTMRMSTGSLDYVEVADAKDTEEKEVPKTDKVQAASTSRVTIKRFAPKVSNPTNRDVDSDEWSNSDNNESW
eukprot:306083_1